MEAYCRHADMVAQRYGALEVRCRRPDVEVFASRALEVWRHAVGVVVRRYGGVLQVCRRGGIEVLSFRTARGPKW